MTKIVHRQESFDDLPPARRRPCLRPRRQDGGDSRQRLNGLDVHTLLAVMRMFSGVYRNYVFLSVGVVDAGNFKGAGEIENLERHIKASAERYAEQMRRQGFYAEAVTAIGTDVVETSQALAAQVTARFPSAVFFGGQLVFKQESRLTRLLHNYTVFTLQKEFFGRGLPFLIVPVRV